MCMTLYFYFCISSVQFSHSVVSNSLWPHEPQHARPPCPSPTPGVHPNPCLLSQWCHPAVSSSVVPFSSCLQSLPASGSFPMSQGCSMSCKSSTAQPTTGPVFSLGSWPRLHIPSCSPIWVRSLLFPSDISEHSLSIEQLYSSSEVVFWWYLSVSHPGEYRWIICIGLNMM